MKILFTFGCLAWSFPSRLKAFTDLCIKNGHSLYIIEIFSKYAEFKQIPNERKEEISFTTLFEGKTQEDIASSEVKVLLDIKLSAIDPDVIIGGPIQFVAGALSLSWAKKNNKGYVSFDDAKYDTFRRNPIIDWARKTLISNVDAFLVPTKDWNKSANYWGLKTSQVFYGYNVVNNEFWSKIKFNKLQETLPNLYFINIVRQVKKKNLLNLLLGYKKYIESGGTIPLLLVGDGPEHSQLVECANNCPQIFFLPVQEDLRWLYRNAKFLFLSSYKQETWGLTTNESMAAGVPACVSLECGSASIINNGVNGFLFNPHSLEEIAETFHKAENIDDNNYMCMINEAQKTINQWGLDRFAKGALDACTYAHGHKHKLSVAAKLILLYWKGH